MLNYIIKIIVASFIIASIITLLVMVNEIRESVMSLYDLIAKSAFF